MANKFNTHFDEITNQQDRGVEFKKKIEELSGKNWKEEISKLSKEFGLNTTHIMKEVKDMLAKSLDGEELKNELHEDLELFSFLYQKTKIKAFKESEEIVDAVKAYVEKIKKTTEKRLASVLFGKPNMIERFSPFKDALHEAQGDEKQSESVEHSDEQKEKLLLTKITDILHAGLLDTEIIPTIKAAYLEIYKKTLFSKTFYKILGLSEKYIEILKSKKDLSIPVVALAVLVKKNPSDDHARADLEREIDRISHPTFKTEGEQDIKKPGVKVITTINLSEKDTNRFKKPEQKPQEEKQAPTTNPLEVVGKTMTHQEFISACGLSYEEIRKHEMKGESMPARYLSYNKTPLKDTSIAHFFTIGEEVKGIHRVPINVFISQDPNKTFNEGEIYEIKVIGMLDSKKSGDTKQSKSVQGELIVEEPESIPGKSALGNHPQFKKLLKVT